MAALSSKRASLILAIAADAVLVAHVMVAVFAIGGGFLILVDPIYALAHLPVVLWVAVVNLARWTCPLTPLEQGLRSRSGQKSFEGSWIRHYCEPILRPFGLPRRLELVAGISILIWNLCVYAWVLYRLFG